MKTYTAGFLGVCIMAYTYLDLYNMGRKKLKFIGDDSAFDARELLLFAADIPLNKYIALAGQEAPYSVCEKYKELIKKRSERVPLQQLMGRCDFFGYEFKINEDVLIPRIDTETVIETCLDAAEKSGKNHLKILDLCTGSGCIGITLFLELKKMGIEPDLTLSDISEKALIVAKENASHLGVDAKIEKSDLFCSLNGSYDMIVSNPPYIKSDEIEGLMPEVFRHEPHLALDGGADGLLFYRKIFKDIGSYLVNGGVFITEIGYDEGESLIKLYKNNGFSDVKIIKDLSGNDRVAFGKADR
jgi:release factor glutamine methyltransferase